MEFLAYMPAAFGGEAAFVGALALIGELGFFFLVILEPLSVVVFDIV
jgi:hypothetical protein